MYLYVDGIFTRHELLDYTSFPPETPAETLFYELASHTCKFETVVELLERGNDNLVLQTLEKENTTLHVAAMNHCCKVEIIQLLIRMGVNISAKNSSRKTALHLALENDEYNHDVIYELLSSGSPLQELDNNNNTPLLIAVGNKICDSQVIKVLISRGSDININSPHKSPPLLRLFENEKCNVEAVKLLLDNGAKISDFSNSENLLQIFLRIGKCKVDIVQELIDRKEDVLAKTEGQENLLHLVVRKNNCYNLLRHLLKTTSLDINETDIANETPLHIIIRSHYCDKYVVSLLLAHGADVNLPNYCNNGPLHFALYKDNYSRSIVSILLDAGASVSMLNKDKMSPLGIIVKKFMEYPDHHKHCLSLLIRCAVKQSLENCKESDQALEGEALRSSLCPDVKYFQYVSCLSSFIDMCHQELIKMKNHMLKKHLSLFDVLRSCKPRIDENIIKKVLEVFLYPCYPLYKHYIVECLGRSKLVQVLYTLPFYSSFRPGDQTNSGKKVILFDTCVDSVVRYLNNEELFYLCVAYYKPETTN